MTLLLKQLFAFLKLLNSDQGTNQIAAGLAFGIILGFSPFLSLQTFIALILIFFFRVQMGAAFLSGFFFKFIAYITDPLSDRIGRLVLENENLRGLFISLNNMPLVPMTRFNNSIVMGSGIIGLALVMPLFFLFKVLVFQYRQQFVSRFQSTKFWKLFTATSFYKWYAKYNELYG